MARSVNNRGGADAPVVDTGIADPAPLGLAGFALTTTLLSGVNQGSIKAVTLTWVGMALFYGGLGQFMAGMWEFRNNNTFGATAFSSYGAFWMGLAIMVVFEIVGRPVAGGKPAIFFGGDGAVWFLFLWAIFTTYMFVASLRVSGIVAVVFLLLALTFFALWLGANNGDAPGHGWTAIGGWLGYATAIAAFYGSFAGVVNRTWGRAVLPTYPLNRPLIGR
jgi:succinate-acetate transporter protein